MEVLSQQCLNFKPPYFLQTPILNINFCFHSFPNHLSPLPPSLRPKQVKTEEADDQPTSSLSLGVSGQVTESSTMEWERTVGPLQAWLGLSRGRRRSLYQQGHRWNVTWAQSKHLLC